MPPLLFWHRPCKPWKAAFRKEILRQNINFPGRDFWFGCKIEARDPSISFLVFFLVIFGFFFSSSHLKTCNLPNCSSTLTPALHRKESSVEWLPKIKNILHNTHCQDRISRLALCLLLILSSEFLLHLNSYSGHSGVAQPCICMQSVSVSLLLPSKETPVLRGAIPHWAPVFSQQITPSQPSTLQSPPPSLFSSSLAIFSKTQCPSYWLKNSCPGKSLLNNQIENHVWLFFFA